MHTAPGFSMVIRQLVFLPIMLCCSAQIFDLLCSFNMVSVLLEYIKFTISMVSVLLEYIDLY